MGRAPNPGAASPRVSAHVVPKGPPQYRSTSGDREDDDAEEKTTIESGWEDEASTTIEQGEVADKIRAAGIGAQEPPRRSITNITSTNAHQLDEPTVDDQRANLSIPTPPVLAHGTNARLVITGGNDAGQELEVRPGKTYTIGRAIDNDVVLTDIAVSRKHFDILRDPEGWVIVDRGSGNGTLVNGNVEDQPLYLGNGDVIEIGNTMFRFDVPNAPGLERQMPSRDDRSRDLGSFEDDEEMSTVAGKQPPTGRPAGIERPREPLPEPRRDLLPRSPSALAVAASPTIPPGHRPKTQPPPPPASRPRSSSAPPPYASPLMSQPMSVSPLGLGQSPNMSQPGMQRPMTSPPVPMPMAMPMPLSYPSPSQPPPMSHGPSGSMIPTTLPGQGMGGGGPNQQQMLQHLVQSHAMPPGMQPPNMQNGMAPQHMRHPTSQPPYGQYPNVADSSGAQHHHQMIVANGMPRDATSTALVPPTPYNGVPIAQPPAYEEPTISRRTKFIIGGVALAILAAAITVAVAKSNKESPVVEGMTDAGQTDGDKTDQVAINDKKPDPVIKPDSMKTETDTKKPDTTGKPEIKTETKKPDTTLDPKKPDTTLDPKKPDTTVKPEIKPEIKTETKKPEIKPEIKTETKKPEIKVETKKPETKPETKKPETKIETKVETKRPETKRGDTSAVKAKASEQFRAKNFAGAAATLRAAAAGAAPADVSDLKGLASKYETFGKLYNSGMAPAAKATDAYAALRQAKNYDPEGAFAGEIKTKLAEVSAKAAPSYLTQGKLEESANALRDAEAYNGSTPTLQAVRKALESKATELYNAAIKDPDSEESKAKLQRVLKIVDSKSPLFAKAKKALG